eukprot:g35599.t1
MAFCQRRRVRVHANESKSGWGVETVPSDLPQRETLLALWRWLWQPFVGANTMSSRILWPSMKARSSISQART